ncbi:Ig-like domain-containing protein, partial [Agromyces sp. CCNWLW208]
PTVTIDQGSAQPDPSGTSPIVFDVVFSEPVNGFTGADVQLRGTAKPAGATVVALSATQYRVQVTGMSKGGTVTASIPAGAVVDAAGNPNVASTSTDGTVTFNKSGRPGRP